MTKLQFDSLYLGKAIYCDTEEKANEFLALADSVGYMWFSGKSLIEKNFWQYFKKETCYRITKDGMFFANTTHYGQHDYQIIEYQLQPERISHE